MVRFAAILLPITAAAAVFACTDAAADCPSSTIDGPRVGPIVQERHFDDVQLPVTGTLAERIEEGVRDGRIRGVLRGVVGGCSGAVIEFGGQMAVTEFAFTITNAIGPNVGPYRVGQTIKLRIGGGTADGVTTVWPPAGPPVATGQELYVLIVDVGEVFGGHQEDIVVLPPNNILYEVRNGVVTAHGDRIQPFSEPEAVFEAHFR